MANTAAKANAAKLVEATLLTELFANAPGATTSNGDPGDD
jgi:hypothetical protein